MGSQLLSTASLYKEEGSVSVYLLFILVALFLFHVLLLDIVRYRMSHMEGETAARAAGRSVLAGFQTSLAEYGLFGVLGSDEIAKEAVTRTVAKPLPAMRGLTLFDTRISSEQVTVQFLYHLGDHYVFRRQVLEKMKYIAGIEFVREVGQKLSQGKRQIAQAQQHAQMSQRMEAHLRKREKVLGQAWETAQLLVRTSIEEAEGSEISDAQLGAVQQILDTLTEQVHSARAANWDLRKELEKASSDPSSSISDVALPHASVLPSIFFAEYTSKAGTVVSMFGSVANAQMSSESGAAESARDRLVQFGTEWLSAKSQEEQERQREMGRLGNLEADERSKLDREVKKAGELWKEDCQPKDSSGYVNELNAYRKLEGKDGLYHKYKQYNMHDTVGGIGVLRMDDSQAFGLEALTMLNRIAELAESLRDEVLVNEYALTFFTYRTWDKMNGSSMLQPSFGDKEGHVLDKHEAEYILYGLPGCMLNISAAQTEIFALRTALRTVEELAMPKQAAALGTPMLAILAALAEGAKQANADTDKLLSGESVDLPFLPGAVMNYKDHLRLFYLLHSHDASVLSRMQALIELNTSADLMKHYSAVRVNVTARPQLWLLSGSFPAGAETVVSY